MGQDREVREVRRHGSAGRYLHRPLGSQLDAQTPRDRAQPRLIGGGPHRGSRVVPHHLRQLEPQRAAIGGHPPPSIGTRHLRPLRHRVVEPGLESETGDRTGEHGEPERVAGLELEPSDPVSLKVSVAKGREGDPHAAERPVDAVDGKVAPLAGDLESDLSEARGSSAAALCSAETSDHQAGRNGDPKGRRTYDNQPGGNHGWTTRKHRDYRHDCGICSQ